MKTNVQYFLQIDDEESRLILELDSSHPIPRKGDGIDFVTKDHGMIDAIVENVHFQPSEQVVTVIVFCKSEES